MNSILWEDKIIIPNRPRSNSEPNYHIKNFKLKPEDDIVLPVKPFLNEKKYNLWATDPIFYKTYQKNTSVYTLTMNQLKESAGKGDPIASGLLLNFHTFK
tara:strand:+ start:846 stop:1145 length:300 start_codon:yes stop_codon:yes gene_type:complete